MEGTICFKFVCPVQTIAVIFSVTTVSKHSNRVRDSNCTRGIALIQGVNFVIRFARLVLSQFFFGLIFLFYMYIDLFDSSFFLLTQK